MIVKSIEEVGINELDEKDRFKRLSSAATSRNFSVVVWSLPQEESFHLLIDLSDRLRKGEVELENSKPGFIVSPFNNNDGKEIQFLNGDIIFSGADESIKIDPSLSPQKLDKLNELLRSLPTDGNESPPAYYSTEPFEEHEPSFTTLVEQGIEEIKKGTFEKFVPSRTTEIPLSDSFDGIEKLFELRDSYANAFCYFMSSPSLGTWMAATPELLIEMTDQTHFRTVALAGTQKLESESLLGNIAWTQKEIEEQAMVSRYIINCFKKIRLREFSEKGPKTVKAGNMAHLKTEYTVNMEDTSFPLLGSVMLNLLHPTSAVCGMPLSTSKEFLNDNEGYDRQLFAGYLGPVNVTNQTNIFVNLRCMQIFKNKGILYAGAGVTDDSIPEKEFLETEMKFKTLLNILG